MDEAGDNAEPGPAVVGGDTGGSVEGPRGAAHPTETSSGQALKVWGLTIGRVTPTGDIEIYDEPVGSGLLRTEHALRMGDDGMHVRYSHPTLDRIYPLVEWIADRIEEGCQVYRRRIVVVEDWARVLSDDQP